MYYITKNANYRLFLHVKYIYLNICTRNCTIYTLYIFEYSQLDNLKKFRLSVHKNHAILLKAAITKKTGHSRRKCFFLYLIIGICPSFCCINQILNAEIIDDCNFLWLCGQNVYGWAWGLFWARRACLLFC